MRLHTINNKPDSPEDPYLQSSLKPVTLANKESSSSDIPTPSILPENKINHSLPKSVRFSKDFVAQATGFYNNDNIIKYLPTLGTNNVTIEKRNGPSLSDEGHHSTLRSCKRNTNPSYSKSLQ